MNSVCAWCGKDMGTKDGKGIEGDSHDICGDCLKAQVALLKTATPVTIEISGYFDDAGEDQSDRRSLPCPIVPMGHTQNGVQPIQWRQRRNTSRGGNR